MEKTYAILLLIVLAYGAWKGLDVWRAYRKRLRVKLEAVPPGPEIDSRNPELPGKVRVVPRVGGDAFSPNVTQPGLRAQRPVFPALEPAAEKFPPVDVIVVGAGRNRAEPVPQAPVEPEPEHEKILAGDLPVLQDSVEESLPVLMPEPEPVPPAPVFVPEPVAEPEPVEAMIEEDVVVAPVAAPEPEPVAPLPEPIPVQAAQLEPAPVMVAEQQDMFAGEPMTVAVPAPRRESVAARASALYETEVLEPVNPLGNSGGQPKIHEEVQDVIAVHVVARNQPFHGEDLLRAILSFGLRFGEMSIFHRHEKPTGQGLVLFSMAKAVEPGTFDLEGMTGEAIPGVSFFQSLPGVNSIHAFDIMMDTAKRLAHELDGEILDQQQNPLTRQLIEHYRERVAEFERRRLMGRH